MRSMTVLFKSQLMRRLAIAAVSTGALAFYSLADHQLHKIVAALAIGISASCMLLAFLWGAVLRSAVFNQKIHGEVIKRTEQIDILDRDAPEEPAGIACTLVVRVKFWQSDKGGCWTDLTLRTSQGEFQEARSGQTFHGDMVYKY